MADLTRYDVERNEPFIYIWRVESVPIELTCESPGFGDKLLEMTNWRLWLFFSSLDSPPSCCIQRMHEDGGPDTIEIQFELTLLYTKTSSVWSAGHFKKNEYSKRFIFPERYSLLDEIIGEVRSKYAFNIRCLIWRKTAETSQYQLKLIPAWKALEGNKFKNYSSSKRVQVKKSEMHRDELVPCPFEEVYNKFKNTANLSDVCLRSGTKSFPAHKHVLSSRSPVFKAMFTADMKEKTSKCIDIPDLDADTLNRLLWYIYKNEVQELTWKIAANLFKAADKYELIALKERCSCFLKSNVSKSNACKILLLADMHSDSSLKNSVQKFILNNPEIVYSDVWKAFKQNHSKLAFETLERITLWF